MENEHFKQQRENSVDSLDKRFQVKEDAQIKRQPLELKHMVGDLLKSAMTLTYQLCSRPNCTT